MSISILIMSWLILKCAFLCIFKPGQGQIPGRQGGVKSKAKLHTNMLTLEQEKERKPWCLHHALPVIFFSNVSCDLIKLLLCWSVRNIFALNGHSTWKEIFGACYGSQMLTVLTPVFSAPQSHFLIASCFEPVFNFFFFLSFSWMALILLLCCVFSFQSLSCSVSLLLALTLCFV